MYKLGEKVETPFGIGVVVNKGSNYGNLTGYDIEFKTDYIHYKITMMEQDLKPYVSAHDKLLAMGLRLKITKNYADGVFSHEWWDENDNRVIDFYIDEKVTTVYEGSNEIMAIIPQYLEELEE